MSHSPHIAHIFSMHVFFFSLKCCCMTFLLLASAMSLLNESTSLLLKVSHLVARYTDPLFECFINYFIWSTSRGSPFKKSVGGWTLFRSHLSNFVSAVGSIFQIFVLLRYNFLSLRPFSANFVLFVCFRAIKTR